MPNDQAKLVELAQTLAERALALGKAEGFWPLLAEALTGAFACERATLFKAVRGHLVSCYAQGVTEPFVVAEGEGVAGQVCASRKVCLSNDAYADGRFNPKVDQSSGFKTRNLLAAPLIAQDRVVGVVELVNKDGGFTPEDASGMEFLASQIAMIFALFGAEERHDQLAFQVLQVEKMAAIGRLAAGFTHEVRNPLTVIGGYTEMLLRKPRDPQDAEALEKIRKNVHRIEALVKNMLSFARASNATVVPVDVCGLIETTLELVLLESKWRNTVEVVRDFDRGVPQVAGNVNSLTQVYLNLMSNAFQAMEGKPGSRLTLKVRASADRRELVTEVADNGPGIPLELQERVFQAFFTTKGKNGTGLGLSIVQGIVQNHGGRISLNSAPGRGTTFTVSFPVPAGAAPAA